MPRYRRADQPGGTYFLTIVTFERRPIFRAPDRITLLGDVMRRVRVERPFTTVAAVILHDHLHLLMRLPQGDSDFSSRVGLIKAGFTRLLRDRGWADDEPVSGSRRRRREATVWQRRFWEHRVRDDISTYCSYIHYNPVRHGYVHCPHAWPWSSFHGWVRHGWLGADWFCRCGGRDAPAPDFESIERRVRWGARGE